MIGLPQFGKLVSDLLATGVSRAVRQLLIAVAAFGAIWPRLMCIAHLHERLADSQMVLRSDVMTAAVER